jgi:hypothetical protein
MIKIPEEIYNKNNSKDFDNMLQKLEEEKNKDSLLRGFLKINNVYVSYDSILTLDNVEYYINSNNANGTHIFKYRDITKSMSKMQDLMFSQFEGLLDRCLFAYKIIKYDNINFIYVFNNKYKHMFDDNDLE